MKKLSKVQLLRLSILLRVISLIIINSTFITIDSYFFATNLGYLFLVFYFIFCLGQIVGIIDEIIKIRKSKTNIRELSIKWWNSLDYEEQLELEKEYFDSNQKGETTEIDIEAMYRLWN